MPDALVTTKVRVPRTRTEQVPRPRLREALARHEGRRLTLVSAPAGFGKTTLLSEWLEDRSGDGRSVGTGKLIEILTLQALAPWGRYKREQAVGTLTRALALAEPEGYVRTFVDEGAPMGELLSATLEARQRGNPDATRIPTRYLAKLLAILAQESAAPGAVERLSEPLSEREMKVLALVAAGKSNGEIANSLFVSLSTVKTHINNLYRKLGTRSRTQAIARARELGLI